MKYFFSLKTILQPACTLLAAGFICTSSGQTVNLTGTVKDSSTKIAISGALVSLKGLSFNTLTDTNGVYSLVGSAVHSRRSSNALIQSPVLRNSIIFLGVTEIEKHVRIDVFDLSGRCIVTPVDENLGRGYYHIDPLTAVRADRVYLVRIQTGGCTTVFRIPNVNDRSIASHGLRAGTTFASIGKAGFARAAAMIDTLVVSAAGHATVRKAISSYTAVNDFLLTANGPHLGTISFENGSYQSCIVPLVITVIDSDLSIAAIPVNVKSTTDPAGITAVLKKTAGAAGTYSDSVFFSIVKSDSARRLIKVRDGDTVTAFYGDVFPPALVYASTVWTGLPGNVQPKGSPIIGVIHGLGITLWDPDITDSAVTIAVWSKRDTAGLRVLLAKVPLSSGDYIGKIGLSLRQSRGDSVLAVGPASDTIFMKYHDLTPKADIMGNGCIWLPMPAIMFLDSARYHGTASVMTINLTDDDIEDSTAVVFVTSTKDPTGIKDTLRGTGTTIRNFIGTVGFTTGASRPGLIAVADGDSVKVTYMDDSPVQPVTQAAVWSSK